MADLTLRFMVFGHTRQELVDDALEFAAEFFGGPVPIEAFDYFDVARTVDRATPHPHQIGYQADCTVRQTMQSQQPAVLL